MKTTVLISTCCLLAGAASAQLITTAPANAVSPMLPGPFAAITPAPPVYETARPVAASSLLPQKSLKGPDYRVASEADPSGMLYSFRIESDYGTFKPQSLQMMRVRLAEVQAIDRLQELSEEPMFLQGVGKQLENTMQATGKALMNPVKTIKQMPVGFKKFAGDIQAQTAVGQVYGESGSPAYSQVKRQLASRLGVDPYSDNQPLQNLLNEVAKNQNRGQLVASIGTLVVGGGAGLALNMVEMNDDFQALIRNKSAQQLQIDNRSALIDVGCPAAAVDRFLTTPGYTATNCTAITRAIATLRNAKGIKGVLENLPPFAGPESILFGQTQIQMAAQFHRAQKPLKSVKFIGGTPVWTGNDGVTYVFSPLEYLYWNEEIDIGLSNIRRETGAAQVEFWISGTATDRAMSELAARGVIVKENTFRLLWPDLS